jgi:outer membrane protein OmpA-like peptidoglycan-associated protein
MADNDLFKDAPWSVSAGLGRVNFEGDEVVQDSFYISLRLGYDLTPRWTIEGDLGIMPSLEKTEFADNRFALDDDTWGVRIGANTLFHLRNTENMHWDPFLSLGGAFVRYGTDMGEGKNDKMAMAGGGLFYHFNDAWALRGDVRTVLTSDNTEANILFALGANYRWGTRRKVELAFVGGMPDSDGDGLIDLDEGKWKTDPHNPDSDGDGLLDGEEVHRYSTDPLNPDSDMDLLTDGQEVKKYTTNPNDADTDDGGVTDGHEVMEDNTDPLDPADDLKLYRLDILFDYDKATVRKEYYNDLDIVVKVLKRDPQATAKIEGHADKRPKSSPEYNLKLSKRRARSVLEYLVNVGGISEERLTSEGFGFSRPVAPNDTPENMQKNRRTDIYIRSSGQRGSRDAALEVAPDEILLLPAASEPAVSADTLAPEDYPVK